MEYIKIGVITNTHGLKGTVKVKSFTDFLEERYQQNNPLYIQYKNEYIKVTVKGYKTVKNLEYIDFNEFHDINDVEKFKGCDLLFPKELIHALEEDEFYFDELKGMNVYTDSFVGHVIDVREYPQAEYIVVKREGKKNAIIPFMKKFVKSVDKEEGRIVLEDVEGLL
jgi:16S rRNA processing protein RimM